MKYKIHRFFSILSSIFMFAILFLGILLSYTSVWAEQAFGNVTLDEIVFHLKVPLQGTDTTSIVSFVQMAFLPTVKICCVLLVLYLIPLIERRIRLRMERATGKQVIARIEPPPPIFRFQRQKVAFLFPRVPEKLCSLFIVAVFLFELCSISKTYALSDYIYQQVHPSTWIESNYVSPTDVTITWPSQKRNLIYIFLESMESSYASSDEGGYYPENLIPELTKLADENINFSNREHGIGGALATPSTGWTVAGMFAQTSGLPLKLPVDGNSMDSYSTFFPGVTSIGELLEDSGYQNCIMFGSDAAFAGRGNYFSQHGNYEICDYNWANQTGQIPQDYHVFWGFEDNRLFEMAKEKILELSRSDKPFDFTLLTVDTHFPDGYRCDLCQNEHDTDYKDALSCSSRQVYQFVQWIQQQDFYQNTTIVISGDHLTMSAEVNAEIPDTYQRSIYNCIINSVAEPEVHQNRAFSTMDMFPTTLAALGCKIDGNRLALGTNLFSEEETLLEKYGYNIFCDEISKRSSFYNNLMY